MANTITETEFYHRFCIEAFGKGWRVYDNEKRRYVGKLLCTYRDARIAIDFLRSCFTRGEVRFVD